MAETLFGDDGKPDAAVVRELVDRFGFKREKVERWTASQAVTTLHARRKEEAVALRHAAEAAGEERPADAPPGRVPAPLKAAAALYLEAALAGTGGDLMLAVSYAVCHLEPDQVRRLAAFMAKKFREAVGDEWNTGASGPGARPAAGTARPAAVERGAGV